MRQAELESSRVASHHGVPAAGMMGGCIVGIAPGLLS